MKTNVQIKTSNIIAYFCYVIADSEQQHFHNNMDVDVSPIYIYSEHVPYIDRGQGCTDISTNDKD